MKTIITLILLIGIGGGAWWWFHRTKDEEVRYQTAAIGRGELTQVVTATGTLNPVVNVQVGSQISGNIKKLAADFNSPVKAGEMVAQLDPAIYQAIVHQAEGDLANSKAQWELAKLTAKRKEDLVTQHAAAQADLDSALAALHQSEAAVALVNQPTLLLADEPTGNLDSRTSIEIMEVFQRLNDGGMTIVMVTHELDIARYTKRNVVMRDGLIVTDTAVNNRLTATAELRALDEAHEAVQLHAPGAS